jgi:N-carbamoyl-L-amino-acid hydrolase
MRLRVDGRNLLDRLDTLAAIGGLPDGGVTRVAYSPLEVRARDLVGGWLHQSGFSSTIDPAGNLIARLPGTDGIPGTLAMGSHLDTVVRAGTLDGVYGVLGAVAVADALRREQRRLRHDLTVIAFCNEEGSRGTPGLAGSQAIAGKLTDEDLVRPDDEGVPLAERIRSVGGRPDALADAAWPPGVLAGYLELHIEQGPVLWTEGKQIGVVSGITGKANVDLVISGTANHAGTTPMDAREDAALAAADLVLGVERLASDGLVRVATTGTVQVSPGVRNVVGGEALVGVDLRDLEDTQMKRALDTLAAAAREVARRRRVRVELKHLPFSPAARCDERLATCIASATDQLGLSRVDLPSGAGHDAQMMAELGPIGMIFVPSVEGISHAPAEHTAPDDLVAGANVLLHALLKADDAVAGDR